MSLGEKEIEILQKLKDIYYNDTVNENQKFGGIKIGVLANMVNLDYGDTFNKYRLNLIACKYAEKPFEKPELNKKGIDAFLKITQAGIDYLDNMGKEKIPKIKHGNHIEHYETHIHGDVKDSDIDIGRKNTQTKNKTINVSWSEEHPVQFILTLIGTIAAIVTIVQLF